MKNKIAKIVVACAVIVASVMLIGVPAFADVDCNQIPVAAKEAAGCNDGYNTNALPGIIVGILYAVIGVAGLVAVVFVLIGGINYMTSTGDGGKLKKAKDTILYALIGLAICALAFAIVNWTIGAIQGSGETSAEASESTTDGGSGGIVRPSSTDSSTVPVTRRTEMTEEAE